MRTLKLITLAVFTLLLTTAPAHADINAMINFDDLVGFSGQGAIGDPLTGSYMGLHWSNFYFQNPNVFDNGNPLSVGYQNGVVSNPNIAYNGYGNDGLFFVDPGTSFTLTSAYFTSTAFWLPSTNEVVVTGFLLGVEVGSQHVAINDQNPTLANFGWVVDGVGFSTATSTAAGFDFVLDNLQLGTPAPGSVPEPGAVFLFGAVGAALLPLLRRRFQRA